MRVFLAGASGVIGVRLIPLLVRDGHEVAGMTRSPGKAAGRRRSAPEAGPSPSTPRNPPCDPRSCPRP